MKKEIYFTTREMIQRMMEVAKQYNHDELVTNIALEESLTYEDDYITYEDEAIEALEQVGIFNALEEVRENELEYYNKSTLDYSSPTEVANMLWFYRMRQLFRELDIERKYITVSELLTGLTEELTQLNEE